MFGGTAIRPSQPSYQPLTISADTTLFWPLETMEGVPYLAAQVDVTATTNGLNLILPPANQGAPGAQSIITDVGANAFMLADNAGNPIVSITAGVSWLVTLIDNSSVAGMWRAYQLGATVSNANAGALAGLGLQANGSKLQVQLPRFNIGSNTLLDASYRAAFIVWNGPAGTLQLDAASSNGAGWFCLVTSQGSDAVTISCTGINTINGDPTLVLEPGNSAIIESSGNNYQTVGNFQSPLSILNGGTGSNNAPGALTNLGGSSLGTSIFTAPNASAVLALLGITGNTFTESTVSTNQAITLGNSQTAFVCTAGLTMSLPLSAGGAGMINFCIAIFAEGGAVTLAPQPSDQINNGVAGANLVMPQGTSGMLMTDANGNWWLFFFGVAQSGSVTATHAAVWSADHTIQDAGLPPALVTGVTTAGRIATFPTSFSTNIHDSGVPIASVVLLTGAPTAGNVTTWQNATTIQDSGTALSALARLTGAPTAGRVATWQNATTVQDSGTLLTALVLLTAFTTGQTLAAAGSQPLPGGLIIKWGTSTGTNNAFATINFPVAFPNACFGVVAVGNNASETNHLTTGNYTAASFGLSYAGSVAASGAGFWIALGN